MFFVLASDSATPNRSNGGEVGERRGSDSGTCTWKHGQSSCLYISSSFGKRKLDKLGALSGTTGSGVAFCSTRERAAESSLA